MNPFSRWQLSLNQKQRRSLVVRLFCICLLSIGIFICIPMVNSPSVSAQSINTINGQITNLRSRINRLEQTVRNLNRSNSPNVIKNQPPTNNTNTGNPPVIDGQAIGRSDPLFERLATLIIELKEDVKNLDRRITNIEQKTK